MLGQTGLLCQQHGQIDAGLPIQDERTRFDELFNEIGIRCGAQRYRTGKR